MTWIWNCFDLSCLCVWFGFQPSWFLSPSVSATSPSSEGAWCSVGAQQMFVRSKNRKGSWLFGILQMSDSELRAEQFSLLLPVYYVSLWKEGFFWLASSGVRVKVREWTLRACARRCSSRHVAGTPILPFWPSVCESSPMEFTTSDNSLNTGWHPPGRMGHLSTEPEGGWRFTCVDKHMVRLKVRLAQQIWSNLIGTGADDRLRPIKECCHSAKADNQSDFKSTVCPFSYQNTFRVLVGKSCFWTLISKFLVSEEKVPCWLNRNVTDKSCYGYKSNFVWI